VIAKPLVERLREYASVYLGISGELCDEAAALLEQLTEDRDRHERDVDVFRQRWIEKCAEVERLLVALNAEWAYAHSEACTNVGDCESFGKERICSYPRPSALSRSAV
jgi:hypothetical protein